MPPMGDLTITDSLWDYMRRVTLREPAVLQRVREETASHPHANMQISPDQGQFMALLIHLLDARKTLEVGVFTGYSSLSVALAMPDDGRIIACDVNEEWTSIARRYWREAGVEKKNHFRFKPPLLTPAHLLAPPPGRPSPFSLIPPPTH